VNKAGKFNVPFGKYTNPTICDSENLWAAAIALNGAHYSMQDFEPTVGAAKRGDAVYFDCPYWPASESANFTNYTKGGFTSEDQTRLRDCALRIKKRGVHVLLSNADVPPVRALYAKGFKIERVEAPRRINSNGSKRGTVGELLIT
jgi:DNA adenine methylase